MGNKSIANAINETGKFAQRHGVDPSGREGWQEGEYGWRPPYIPPSLVGPQQWDLELVEGTETFFTLHRPEVRKGNDDIEDYVTITNSSFTPTAGEWLVAKITDLSTLAITSTQLDTWTGFPSAYEFDSGSFEAAHLPLWRFYDTDAEDRVQIMEDVYGKKLVPGRTLSVQWATVAIPSATTYQSVPVFV